ncbi:MAG: hypothetical protein FJ265_19990 [Planctomycetes bacterium]|nr:hypothetical protein [Planctomycetota bacterium]
MNLRTALPASSPEIGDLQLEIAHTFMRQPYRLAVGRRLSPGRNDLGDLLVPVQPAETLLAVVDVRAGGLPLRVDPNAVRIGVRTDQRFQTGATTWRRVGDLLHLHGEPPAPEFLVLIVVDGFVPAEVACRPGARVAFDLRPAAQLVVAVGRRNVPNDWVEADLVPTPGGGEPRPSCLGWDHFLRWRGLEPGRYRLRLNVLDRVVLESDAFELRPGWNSWPPGGTLVDLPPGERVVRLDVLPEEVPGEGSSVDSTWTVVPAGAQELPPGPREWTPSEDGWFRVRQAPADLLITAECFVPVRTSAPIQDTVIRLRRRTLLAVSVDSAEPVELLCKVVEDGVRDPLLLRLDKGNPRDVEFTEVCDEPLELHYAPGTVLEFTVVRSGVTGPPQRVFVGPGPRQEVRVAAPVAAVPPERRR